MLSLISFCHYLGRVLLSKVDHNLACNEDNVCHHCNPAGYQPQENKKSSLLKLSKYVDIFESRLNYFLLLTLTGTTATLLAFVVS